MEETTGWMDGWMVNSKQEGTKTVAPKEGWKWLGNNDQFLHEYHLDNLPQRTRGRQKLEIV